jgi:hypothetical protein
MKPRPSDELLRALRDLEHEEANDALADARWDRVAAGTASAEDLAALDEAAVDDDDGLVRQARALFEPLGTDAKERYAAAIEAELARPQGAAPATPGPATPVSPATPASPATRATRATPVSPASPASPASPVSPGSPRPGSPGSPGSPRPVSPGSPGGPGSPRPVSPGATVIPLGRRRGPWLALASTAVAMAAAVALLVLRAPPGDGLPPYALTFTGGEALQRGEPAAELPRIQRGSRFVMTLRPATPTAGPLEGRAFLVQGGQQTPLEVSARVSPDGAVRLTGTVGAFPGAGDAEIVAVVGHPAALVGDPLAEGAGRRVLRQPVRLVEGP